jgi:sortase A
MMGRHFQRGRREHLVAMVAMLGVGLICLGHSGWIYTKAFIAQQLMETSWRRVQAGGLDAKPWWWADTRPVAKLTLGRGSRELLVLEGSSGRNLAFGPVHDPASVLPGQWGNSVIEGHRDTHFSVLKDLRPGDRVRIELPDGRRASFAVSHLQIVDSRRSRITLDSEAPRLTLVTCYPFDAVRPGGPLRYVVTADWIPPTDESAGSSARQPGLNRLPDVSQGRQAVMAPLSAGPELLL